MTFTVPDYAKARPTLWHLTHRANLARIAARGELLPAGQLAPTEVVSVRRGPIPPQGQKPVLRDQDLLHEKCIEFEGGWTLAQFLADLSSRVFFWSGWPDRPVRQGRNAAHRYSNTDALLRFDLSDLDPAYQPHFSRWNSGATRMQHGRPVRRGPATHRLAQHCDFAPADVVEVTFVGSIRLPATTKVAIGLDGFWMPLSSCHRTTQPDAPDGAFG